MAFRSLCVDVCRADVVVDRHLRVEGASEEADLSQREGRGVLLPVQAGEEGRSAEGFACDGVHIDCESCAKSGRGGEGEASAVEYICKCVVEL